MTAIATPCLTLIAALARNRVIGRDNALPWRLPDDLKRFKALTLGHPVIMGRKTWTSIGRPLPGRLNIVVSRDPVYAPAGAVAVTSLERALAVAAENDATEIFVIGGAEIYRHALPLARRMRLTEIAAEIAGDAFFPEFDRGAWRETAREAGRSPDGLDYAFVTYERS